MNNLKDLNDHLFAQLDRLSEDCKTPEEIDAEAKRAEAVIGIAEQIIRNADLQLKAVNIIATHGERFERMLPMITVEKEA